MKVKNISVGPRGVNTLAGVVMLAPNEERDDLAMTEGEAAASKATGWFEISGDPEPDPIPGAVVSSGRDLDKALESETARADAAEAELAKLKSQVAEAEKGKTDQTQPPALAAVHRGNNSYSVMRGDAELRGGLNKEQAQAFNKLDDAGKEAEVAKYPAA